MACASKCMSKSEALALVEACYNEKGSHELLTREKLMNDRK